MDEAVVVFSRKGLFQTRIVARDVRSREHARKLWPLVSPDALRQMVTWVSPIFEDGKLRRRSHFRQLPVDRIYDLRAHFDDEETNRQRAVQESQEHRRAKELIAAELGRRLDARLAMPWWFKDADGLCCTSRKADEITPAPDAAMPWHPRAPCSGARVA